MLGSKKCIKEAIGSWDRFVVCISLNITQREKALSHAANTEKRATLPSRQLPAISLSCSSYPSTFPRFSALFYHSRFSHLASLHLASSLITIFHVLRLYSTWCFTLPGADSASLPMYLLLVLGIPEVLWRQWEDPIG